jgi:adenosylhomocysteinase
MSGGPSGNAARARGGNGEPPVSARPGDVRDLGLAEAGVLKVEWADRQMPVLAGIRERFAAERPLDGWRISACLHVTSETANLMRTLVDGGADVVLCSSNPLSTQDDVAAALLARYGVPTYAIKGEDRDTSYRHIAAALDFAPQLTMDDGADLVTALHTDRTDLLDGVVGGTEETTTGVIRMRAMAISGRVSYPIVAVN